MEAKTSSIEVDYRLGLNAQMGPNTEQRIADLARIFAARLQGTPTPQPGDAVVLHGYSNYHSSPVTYRNGHLEAHHYDDRHDVLAYCTQPMAPFVDVYDGGTDLRVAASGGYWGTVKTVDLKHIGTVKKWLWLWGEDGAHADGGVYICLTVNQWEYHDDERIY